MCEPRELQPPEHNTTALLGQAYSRLGHRIVEGVVAAGYPQRPAHSGVFAHIDMAGTRLTDLAARANMTPQAMGELVDDLEQRGYLSRHPDPADRRAKLIVLSETGRGCMQAAFDTIGRLEGDLEALLGARALNQLRRSLQRILAEPWERPARGRALGGEP
ncbi:MAG: MarR family winged helix-turn-helix transcriptional regulator [Candidatus Dormibacter sp.]|uniref:MarR family winged helix-turn-helix transcriptional regulator n=1 Tax=Candidatus Dormibacter sp. TaxID=2973982 RepID=UPI000DB1249B|nr:MAG: MarR family transcriptional regulator [Candidatus Dormibacteraeota bacterium]